MSRLYSIRPCAEGTISEGCWYVSYNPDFDPAEPQGFDWVCGDYVYKSAAQKALEGVEALRADGLDVEDIRDIMCKVPLGPKGQDLMLNAIAEYFGACDIENVGGPHELELVESDVATPMNPVKNPLSLSRMPLSLKEEIEVAVRRWQRYKAGEMSENEYLFGNDDE
jgi:hypothetical protein